MKVLFFTDADNKYGASTSMKQMVSNLRKIYDVDICVVLPLHSNLHSFYESIGCRVVKGLYVPFYQGIPYQKWKLPFKYLLKGIEYWCGRIFGVYMLSRRVSLSEIDIIHSNSTREDFGARVAKKYNIPLIWHIREFGDLDYACFTFRRDYIELMNEVAIEFIAVSEVIKRHWINKGLKEDKIQVIYNGCEQNVPISEICSKCNTDIIRLVMIGSINKTKGQYQVIEAIGTFSANQRNSVSLDIIGDGSNSYVQKLKKRINDLGLEKHVKILGYQNNIYEKLHNYDCGIICSKSEGFGRATIEYMMAGLPVIASNAGANPELVHPEKNGVLYRYGDVNDLKSKILEITQNKGKMERMGRTAHEIAVKKFSAKGNASLIYQEYEKIYEEGGQINCPNHLL